MGADHPIRDYGARRDTADGVRRGSGSISADAQCVSDTDCRRRGRGGADLGAALRRGADLHEDGRDLLRHPLRAAAGQVRYVVDDPRDDAADPLTPSYSSVLATSLTNSLLIAPFSGNSA